MATSTNSLIRVTDVCKEYNGGSVHALSHCNLSVKKGEVVAIIGPSGSGKSTLLRSLLGLLSPLAGKIDCPAQREGRLGYLCFKFGNVRFQ